MAAVTHADRTALNRAAIAAVLVVTVIFLAPLYWIGSTAFKPRSLATTVPPTVFFTPETTPFIKLFTKRVQLTKPVDPAVYEAAPWYEQRIYDGGERILKVGDSRPALAISQPLPEQPDHRRHQHDSRGRHGDVHRLWILAVQDRRRDRICSSSSCPRACCRRWSSPSRCT